MPKDDTDRMYDAMEAREDAEKKVMAAVKELVAAGNEEAAVFLRKLVNWRPECGYPYETDYYGEAAEADTDKVPFSCETFMYALVGKQDARTFLCYIDGLARSLGFEGYRDQRLRG